jgi:hypothetical protein
MFTKLSDTNKATTMMESQGRSKVTISRVGMFLALLAIVGIAGYLLNLAALHFLRTDVNPVVEPVSNYAVGAYGFLSTAANIGSGLTALALTVGLYLGIVPPGRSRVGLFLLGLFGVCELLAAIFPIDVGAQATMNGTVHNIVGNISFFGFLAAVILLSWSMGKDEQWRSIRRPALALAFVVTGMAALTIVGANIGIGFGVGQRLFNVTSMGWMLLVALRIRSMARGSLPGQPSRVR